MTRSSVFESIRRRERNRQFWEIQLSLGLKQGPVLFRKPIYLAKRSAKLPLFKTMQNHTLQKLLNLPRKGLSVGLLYTHHNLQASCGRITIFSNYWRINFALKNHLLLDSSRPIISYKLLPCCLDSRAALLFLLKQCHCLLTHLYNYIYIYIHIGSFRMAAWFLECVYQKPVNILWM